MPSCAPEIGLQTDRSELSGWGHRFFRLVSQDCGKYRRIVGTERDIQYATGLKENELRRSRSRLPDLNITYA
eukprot:scaffold2171_cov253-Pinguiococcus_pyrenoidosus.AAC.3